MPAKEGCSVLTTLVGTSASPRALSSISVRRASRCRCRNLSLPSLQSHQAHLSSHGCFQGARGSLSRAGPFAVHPDSLQMTRTSAEVRSAAYRLGLKEKGKKHSAQSPFSYKMIQNTLKNYPFIFYYFRPTHGNCSSYLSKWCWQAPQEWNRTLSAGTEV